LRPALRRSSAEKIYRYFFGDDWKNYECIGLAIRNAGINWFDDEGFWYSRKADTIKAFNWNADPSMFAVGATEVAILRTGVHFFKMSYHHISENGKRYVALRPNNPAQQLKCYRKSIRSGQLYESMGTAINIHAGGDRTTGSRGCQTCPRKQFAEFITFVGDALGVDVPLGIQRRATKQFNVGVGNIPYILLTQAEFNHILELEENEFDTAADMRYQAQHFVNVPKVKAAVSFVDERKPLSVAAVQAAIAELDDEDDILNAGIIGDEDPHAATFEAAPMGVGGEPGEDAPLGEFTESVTEKDDGTVEKTMTATTSTFEQKNVPVFLPQLGRLKWLSAIPGGGMLLTAITWVMNLPPHLQILLGVGTIVTASLVIYLIITQRQKVLEIIAMCQNSWQNPTTHNLIPTAMPEVFGNGERRAAVAAALAPINPNQEAFEPEAG
jgi:hypothetical protein